MHPILFRIPLPHMPLKLWWALAAVIAISAVYAAFALRQKDKQTAIISVVVAAIAAGVAWKFKLVSYEAPNIPIYSYGVMLGLSLVIGWYLTLSLAKADKLPQETMANCYVITALAAIVGSRILYVLTNLDEFSSFADLFAFRKGGLVAYGGFVGGFLGSWIYLTTKKIRLLPWADVAVPSLATGLMVTRIGCYLFGCDFGKRLSDTAPGWLKTLGTFPHWATGTIDSGDGSPAYVRHLSLFEGTPLEKTIKATNHSLPVHPTQIYESLVGLVLFGLLMWQRKHLKFRGQMFFLFVFGYGFLRFLLEIIRDDVERGEYGPIMPEHILIPGCLLLMAIGFVFGISLGITDLRARMAARIVAFVPPLAAYIMLKPQSFGQSVEIQLSTSQWIGLLTALLVSYFYASYWQRARQAPVLAMALGEGAMEPTAADDDDEEAIVEKVVPEEAPKKKKKKRAKAPVEATADPVEKDEADEKSEKTDDEDDAPAGDDKPLPEPT